MSSFKNPLVEIWEEVKASHEREQEGKDPICDFCDGPPVYSYPCRDFDMLSLLDLVPGAIPSIFTLGSKGEWAVCEKCHGYIQARDEEGLLRHCILSFGLQEASFEDRMVIRSLRGLHCRFFANLDGAPCKLD